MKQTLLVKLAPTPSMATSVRPYHAAFVRRLAYKLAPLTSRIAVARSVPYRSAPSRLRYRTTALHVRCSRATPRRCAHCRRRCRVARSTDRSCKRGRLLRSNASSRMAGCAAVRRPLRRIALVAPCRLGAAERSTLAPVEALLRSLCSARQCCTLTHASPRRAIGLAHVANTARLTHYASTPARRGGDRPRRHLPHFTGVSVHDGWKPYSRLRTAATSAATSTTCAS